jgi:hypothetical protein
VSFFLPAVLAALVLPLSGNPGGVARHFTMHDDGAAAQRSFTPDNRQSPDREINLMGEGDQRRNTCFTMRSYYFAHEDSYAPQPVGMTTCDPGTKPQTRHVLRRGRGLEPAVIGPARSDTH